MPGQVKKVGLCPICDAKVELDAKNCPGCQADLALFGVKEVEIKVEEPEPLNEAKQIDEAREVGGEGGAREGLTNHEASLADLIKELGKDSVKEERAIFDEILTAIDKAGALPTDTAAEGDIEIKTDAIQKVIETPSAEEVTEVSAGPVAVKEEGEAPSITSTMEEEKAAIEETKPPVMFECPICNTLVDESATKCPNCGAIFAAEEAEVEVELSESTAEPEVSIAETPIARVEEEAKPEKTFRTRFKPKMKLKPKPERTMVEVAAEPKPAPRLETIPMARPKAKPEPKVAIREDKALYNKLVQSVSEIKPLLLWARKIGVDVKESKKLIDQAIIAGKNKDFRKAIDLVEESKVLTEKLAVDHINNILQSAAMKLSSAKKSGIKLKGVEELIIKSRSSLSEDKFEDAVKYAQESLSLVEKSLEEIEVEKEEEIPVDKKEIADELEALSQLITDSESIGIELETTKASFSRVKNAVEMKNWKSAENILSNTKTEFSKELSKGLADIISSSRDMFLKAKMEGADITPGVRLLKDASIALKERKYPKVIDAVKQYRAEISKFS